MDYNDRTKSTKDFFKKLKNDEELSDFEKTHLENNLPIQVTLSNGKTKATSFLKAFTNNSEENSILIKEELPLRKAIVKALIENKGDFTKFEGSVQGQGKGKLNLDNASTQNNVLDISVLKGMKKPELLKYLKENTYIVNHDKQLVHAETGQKSVDSFFNVIKSFHSGDVFLVFTRPNGQKVPIKLNNKRISNEKAGATVKLLSLLSNVIRTNQSDTILSDKDFKTFLKEKIGEESYNQLESEINLSKKNNNNERLREILEYITYSQNNNEISKLYIDNQGNLTVGRLLQKVNEDLQGENNEFDKSLTAIGFTGFAGQNIDAFLKETLENENEIARFNHLVNFIRYKKSNIIADKFNDNNYIKHVFGIDNKKALVSTNVSVDQDIFGGYSDIFLNNEVTTLEDGKAKAKELKEIENTEIPLAKEVVYNEPKTELDLENEIRDNKFKNKIKYLKSKDLLIAAHFLMKTKGVQNEYGSDTSLLTSLLGISFKEAEELVQKHLKLTKPEGWKLGDNYDTTLLDNELEKYDTELKASETENNSENNRIIENNFVSLSKMDNVTNIREKSKIINFAKEHLDFIPESMKISEQFEQLKKQYPNSETLNKEVNKICGL